MTVWRYYPSRVWNHGNPCEDIWQHGQDTNQFHIQAWALPL